MATVVITFISKARFYVCKMDADFKEKRSDSIFTSKREKRWSMNSQRLEEIVAELMRPIGDLRHNFDTDLSALLEEYLTEAGLHALEADESDDGSRDASAGPVNFAELALLLQQSASIYGRKVDFLYQHVLSVSETLQNSTIEIANTSHDASHDDENTETPTPSRRKRKASTHMSDFAHIPLESGAGARREPGAARPPPTLPRMYIELEPRVLGEGDAPLRDHAGEPIGLLADYHVAWRLQNGLLVEELAGYEERAALRPIPLLELQAAIEANAPPSPPPLREDTPPPEPLDGDEPPAAASTPLPARHAPPVDMPPPPSLLGPKKERKRKSDLKIEELANGHFKLRVDKETALTLLAPREFGVDAAWVRRVVAQRSRALLLTRRLLRARTRELHAPFEGFEFSSLDVSGFYGWSPAEAASATALARSTARLSARRADDSDDDGFFEQSSLGDSDASRVEDYALPPTDTPMPQAETRRRSLTEREKAEAEEWASWRARVAARAAQHEARAPLDVRALAAAVLRQLPPAEPRPFRDVLAAAAGERTDVSRLFLATLFLANSGNVSVIPGAPLSLDSFSLRLLSTDARLYSAAADDPACAPPAPAPAPAAVSGAGGDPAAPESIERRDPI